MGLKHEIDKVIDDVKDASSEAQHRSVAEGEQAKRDLAGDAMTPGEKVGSAVNQAKNTVQAEVDRAKRDVRDNT